MYIVSYKKYKDGPSWGFPLQSQDFLGETEPPETPAVAASPEGPEVEEEACHFFRRGLRCLS